MARWIFPKKAQTDSSMADEHIQSINSAVEQLEQWIQFIPEEKRADFERLVHAIWSANKELEQGDWTTPPIPGADDASEGEVV